MFIFVLLPNFVFTLYNLIPGFLRVAVAMDFYGKRSLPHRSSRDKERNERISPNPLSEEGARFSSPSRCSTSEGTVSTMVPSPAPEAESPWMLSPQLTPSSSLLYQCIASLHRQGGDIYAIAVSKGFVFTGSNSRRIRVWKQPDCMDRGYIKASHGEVRAILAYSNMLFSSHKDHRIRIWNLNINSQSHSLKSNKVATLPRRRSFPLFSKANNTLLHKDSVSCMAYYHPEGLLYTGSYDRTVKAWRVSDGKCVDSFVAHEDNINAILVNQDDGCLFTCSSDGSVKIWRRIYTENSHILTMTLKFQLSSVNAMALNSSFNHCFLYSGYSDGMINLWEKERLCYRFNHGGFLQGHRFAVLCLATVGNLIFSGSEDTTIRVWRREQGSCYHQCLAVLDGHRGPVRCLAACIEIEEVVMGFLVYSASLDGTFKIWRVKVLADDSVCPDITDQQDSRINLNVTEYDMSPVLSPPWVEKKLQGTNFL